MNTKDEAGNKLPEKRLMTQQMCQERENDFENIRTEALRRLEEAMKNEKEAPEELLWESLKLFSGESFRTAKKLEFFYVIKGNEMFISRKEKSVTRATVMIAFRKALELGRIVTGPKKLGCFGASYLYPVFIRIGVIQTTEEKR